MGAIRIFGSNKFLFPLVSLIDFKITKGLITVILNLSHNGFSCHESITHSYMIPVFVDKTLRCFSAHRPAINYSNSCC